MLPTDEEQNRPIIERIHRAPGGPAAAGPDHSRSFARRVGPLLAAMAQATRRRGRGRQGAEMAPLGPICYAACRRKNSPGGWPSSSSESPPTCSGGWPCCAHAANPDPPTLADLPESLVRRFVGRSGKFLLKIYAQERHLGPRRPRSLRPRHPHASTRKLPAIRSRSTKPRGDMKRSYQQAAVYALVDHRADAVRRFRQPPLSLLAMLPLGLGVLQLFGLWVSWASR